MPRTVGSTEDYEQNSYCKSRFSTENIILLFKAAVQSFFGVKNYPKYIF